MVKKLLCSVCNDKYILGMEILLYSLKKHNTIDFDIKIYNRCDLSDNNKKILKKIYNHIIFEDINDPFYINNMPHYMSLLAFKEYNYDRVIYIDCDILCIGNIEKIFNLKENFSICYDTNIPYPKKNKYNIYLINGIKNITELNTGVFIVNKKLLNEIFYEKIKEHAIQNSKKKNENYGTKLF